MLETWLSYGDGFIWKPGQGTCPFDLTEWNIKKGPSFEAYQDHNPETPLGLILPT
jgi:hypothetical protein